MGVHDDKSRARLYAVQALYQMEQTGDPVTSVIAQFQNQRIEAVGEDAIVGETDHTLFEQIVSGVTHQISTVDQILTTVLSANWKAERIDSVARAILRAGIYELTALSAPKEIVLNEYIEVAKAFFEETEVGFINAALDRAASHTIA